MTRGEDGAEGVAALAGAYYRALEQGAPLEPFYATDAEAGDLGPVLKVGSGEGEVFRGAGRRAGGGAAGGVYVLPQPPRIAGPAGARAP